MKRFSALVLTIVGLGLVGCAREPAKPPPTPGVNIQIDKGVEVTAPGVKVKVPQ